MSQLPNGSSNQGPFLQLTIAGHLVWETCPVAVARELALLALAMALASKEGDDEREPAEPQQRHGHDHGFDSRSGVYVRVVKTVPDLSQVRLATALSWQQYWRQWLMILG